MAYRTNAAAVREILGPDYDAGTPARAARSLDGFIATANSMVSRVAVCASDSGWTLSTAEKELIERWLAAHAYCASDPQYAAKNSEKAGGTFAGEFGMGLEGSRYGQMALRLDPSGCLEALDKRQGTASLAWGGTADSDAEDYDERN